LTYYDILLFLGRKPAISGKKQQLLDFPGTPTSLTSSRGPLLKKARHATAEAKDVPSVPEIELDWLKLDL
jgi:hypothetical protein